MMINLPKSWRLPSQKIQSRIKALLFILCLLPLLRLAGFFYWDKLGANPIEFITRSTGTWALSMLMITLAITPLRKRLNLPWLLKLRRMLGLYAFFYACLHLSIYVWLDQAFDLHDIAHDIVKRPFITVGFAAWLMLVPLAVTSNNALIRRLGARLWQRLHRLVYVLTTLGVVHYWWLVKRDITTPLIFAVVLLVLLGYRIVAALGQRVAASAVVRKAS